MSATKYIQYLFPLLLLLLLPAPSLSLTCSKCQEITVDGNYYDKGPRDCLFPSSDKCTEGQDRCISAGITFQLITKDQASTVDFGLKYCGNREVTCLTIQKEMKEAVDYGEMDNFQCHIGTKCEADLCNQLVPIVKPDPWTTSTKPGQATTSTPTTEDPGGKGVYVLNEAEVDIEIEIKNDVEGNDQAQKSGQSKNFSQSSLVCLFLCGLLLQF
jgi:hypothetical protein